MDSFTLRLHNSETSVLGLILWNPEHCRKTVLVPHLREVIRIPANEIFPEGGVPGLLLKTNVPSSVNSTWPAKVWVDVVVMVGDSLFSWWICNFPWKYCSSVLAKLLSPLLWYGIPSQPTQMSQNSTNCVHAQSINNPSVDECFKEPNVRRGQTFWEVEE